MTGPPMTGALPAVDVVIPAFNAQNTIAAAVESCLAQTAPHLRVIVVDDGSTDATAARVAALAARDGRVTLLRQPNGGISAAMNRGIAAGTAPFLARLDADDLSHPDRHRLQLQAFAARAALVALSGAHREIAADGSPTGHLHHPPPAAPADPDWLPAREPALTQPFTMFRRAALDRAGRFRPFPVSEDTDLYWRLAALGPLANLPDILGAYRMHGGSVSSASILHGRRMALCSQLAALSARRRLRHEPDLPLGPDMLALLGGPLGFPASLAALGPLLGLSGPESAWLAPAVAAKLVELAGYRPYELAPADCTFIAQALAPLRLAALRCDPADLARMRAATAARLLRAGRLRDAATLAAALWPHVLARAASGRLYWTKRPA